MANKLRKTWYGFTGNEGAIASDNLSVINSELLSIDATSGKVVSADGTQEIKWVATGSHTYWTNEEILFVRKNENLRVDLNTDADLTQAMVGDKFDINASQVVVTGAAGDQVELVEIIDTRVGRFKIV